jgi:hypothetical protein
MSDAGCWKSGDDTENEFPSSNCWWGSLIDPLLTVVGGSFREVIVSCSLDWLVT